MRDKLRLKVSQDEVTIEEGENTFLGKLMEGTKGKLTIRTPFGKREIHKVKDTKGRVFKDDKQKGKKTPE